MQLRSHLGFLRRRHEESAGELLPKLGKDLAAAHEGLRFNVEAVTHGSLPRFELKAKRLKDEREYQ